MGKIGELVVFVNNGEPPSFLIASLVGHASSRSTALGMMYATDIVLPLAINTFQLGFNRVDRHGLEQRILAEANASMSVRMNAWAISIPFKTGRRLSRFFVLDAFPAPIAV